MKVALYSLSILVPDIQMKFTIKLRVNIGVPWTNLSHAASASWDSLRKGGQFFRPISWGKLCRFMSVEILSCFSWERLWELVWLVLRFGTKCRHRYKSIPQLQENHIMHSCTSTHSIIIKQTQGFVYAFRLQAFPSFQLWSLLDLQCQ